MEQNKIIKWKTIPLQLKGYEMYFASYNMQMLTHIHAYTDTYIRL